MFSQHCALLLYCNQILCFSYELACSTPKLKLSEPRYLLIIGNVNNHPLEHVLNWPHHYSNSVFCSHNLCARFKRNTQKLKFNHVTMHHTELAASRTRWLSYCKEDRASARCAQYMGALKSFESPHYALATCPEICNGLFFRSILRMCVQNLKFVALPVPEIIGGTQKSWAVPVYAQAPFSPKFLIGFCSRGPSEYICQI